MSAESDRDAGMAQALQAERRQWKEDFHLFADDWIERQQRGVQFHLGDITQAWRVCWLPDPHHPNVFGGLLRKVAVKNTDAGLIHPTGQTARAHSPSAKARNNEVYIRL